MFFTRVKSGIIGGIVFFFILFIINSIVIANNNNVSFDVKEKASLSSHAAMAFASELLLVLEVISYKILNFLLFYKKKDKLIGTNKQHYECNGE